MKNYSLLALLALVIFSACSKSSSTPPSSTGKAFYCKIDGTDFTPAGGGRYFNTPVGGIQIVGDTTFTTIELYLSSASTGTYTLTGGTPNGTNSIGSVYINAGNKLYVSKSGKVVITKSASNTISGTFEFTGEDTGGNTTTISNGEFNDITLH